MNSEDRMRLVCQAVCKLLPKQPEEDWVEEGKLLAEQLRQDTEVAQRHRVEGG